MANNENQLESIYKGKTIIITGHTGFKGSWLSIWLSSLGAKVIGLSIDIPCQPSNFEVNELNNIIDDRRVDIREAEKVREIIHKEEPDFIFHLAAQALVRRSYENPLDTILTNAYGSSSILDGLRDFEKKVTVVMITSDKAYDNVEWPWGYRETDNLGGKDPYSASKGMAELAIKTYIESFFRKNNNITIGIARAGNVIGGGDWAEDRIVPDCIRSWSNNLPVDIRNPLSTRPWQHVLEPLSGYLALGAALTSEQNLHGEAFNFGPSIDQNYSVKELINEMKKYWENVSWNDVSKKDEEFHEAGLLKLNCDKALALLNWTSTLKFNETVGMTVNWYKNYYQKKGQKDIYEYSLDQINQYVSLAKEKGIKWSI